MADPLSSFVSEEEEVDTDKEIHANINNEKTTPNIIPSDPSKEPDSNEEVDEQVPVSRNIFNI